MNPRRVEDLVGGAAVAAAGSMVAAICLLTAFTTTDPLPVRVVGGAAGAIAGAWAVFVGYVLIRDA